MKQNKEKSFIYLMGSIILLIVLFVTFIDYFFPQPTLETNFEDIMIDTEVDVIEFGDFQCPICAEAHENVKKILQDYDITFEYKHFPVHDGSLLAAIASECARDQGAFYSYIDDLYHLDDFSYGSYISIAQSLGLDIDVFEFCMENGNKSDKVSSDAYDGIKYEIRGTPTFIIHGRKIEGNIPYEQFARLIEIEE